MNWVLLKFCRQVRMMECHFMKGDPWNMKKLPWSLFSFWKASSRSKVLVNSLNWCPAAQQEQK